MTRLCRIVPVVASLISTLAGAQPVSAARFRPRDIFDLEWVMDPQISPDGRRVIFSRTRYDIAKDSRKSSLWIANVDGSNMRALLPAARVVGSPVWSPDGSRVLFVEQRYGHANVIVRRMDSGTEVRVSSRADSWRGITWSPDGKWLAFSMFVPSETKPPAGMLTPPPGADWGPPPRYVQSLKYRADGQGYLPSGHSHIFVLPASGGTPRQLTDGPFDHGAPSWAPDSRSLVFSANRTADAEYNPMESEVYDVSLDGAGTIRQLTHRAGVDDSPTVSPDGKLIAYSGFDAREQGYQEAHLYLMNRDGSNPRRLAPALDRNVNGGVWSKDGTGIFVQYDNEGDTKLSFITLTGEVKPLADHLGGLSVARPYGGAQFTVSNDGRFAFTLAGPDHPADLATGKAGEPIVRATNLTKALWARRTPATVEEIWFPSSFDQRRIQGWITKPANFDARRKYPLVLEIHGGPFENYGSRFSTDNQLYAADGFVVLSINPRGSSSYGEAFASLINHDYPNHDFDDLMSGVDAVIAQGYVSPDSLYVTGGSGGGILTAWIIGHTQRFRAAVAAKPMINWVSAVLTSDDLAFNARYFFGTMPWDDPESYRKRSPLSYAANVVTPTMLITGEQDYRAPSSEAEQFYGALKLRKVPTAMLRFPDASHDIEAKPSNLIAQVVYTLDWFNKYRSR